MRELSVSTRFKKDLKKAQKQRKVVTLLEEALALLRQDLPLPQRHRPHLLIGNYAGFYECHLTPDWLLIYGYPDKETLELVRLGSHSELFG